MREKHIGDQCKKTKKKKILDSTLGSNVNLLPLTCRFRVATTTFNGVTKAPPVVYLQMGDS